MPQETRVTEILDYLTEPELVSWMLRTPKAKREAASKEALEIGTVVDGLIQLDLFPPPNNLPPPSLDIPGAIEDKVANCMTAWKRFKQDRPDIVGGIKEIQTELRHNSIVGHPDLVFEDDNRWGIIDIKSSRSIYPRYWTQTAQYTELKRLSHHIDTYIRKPRFIGVLRLDKESALPQYIEIADEDAIRYEVRVFEAYRLAYEHNFSNREIIRRQLESEVLS